MVLALKVLLSSALIAYVATRVGDLFITHAPSNAGDGPSAAARQSVRPVARIGRYGEYDLFFVAAR